MIDMNTAEFIASLGRERELQTEAARLQGQLSQLLTTLEAVEHAVAIVYGHFSNGRLTKCNTDPQQVIAVIEDVINAEYEKENLAQWILEAEQGRAKIKRLTVTLQEIWEAGDLNDEQVDAYRRVIPFEGREILPLYESSDERWWYAQANGEKELRCICGHGESSHPGAGCTRVGCQCVMFHQRAKDVTP